MLTITIQIGNSDNKLSQEEWFGFVWAVRRIVATHSKQIHFDGFSSPDSKYQNACWVIELDELVKYKLMADLIECRKVYRQDSVAFTVSKETLFI